MSSPNESVVIRGDHEWTLLFSNMADAFFLHHTPHWMDDEFGNRLPSLIDSIRLIDEAVRHFPLFKFAGEQAFTDEATVSL